MGQLEDMAIFARVIEAGSITLAAEQLGLAKSAVSKRLSALEQKLGLKLISRTTRKSSITEAGKQYYQRSKLILDEVDELNNITSSDTLALSGPLKITVPLSFGLMYLSEPFDLFIQKNPDIQLQVHFSDHRVDLIESGMDLAIRIGELANSNLQAKKLIEIKQLICASPEYLLEHGTPKNPEELKHHKLLKYENNPFQSISFLDSNGTRITGQPKIHCVANNGEFLQKMALSSHGIIQTPHFFVWKNIQDHSLTPILTDFQLTSLNAYAVYPANRHLPSKVRTLIDFLLEHLQDLPFI
ncbi:LysR family transcriptional regulator [Thalassotalea profundi]|uniref:LysR family transcriptional regulator n=1 Tax=Thalassotalea profundi TaxID=2036687 RepID=A0ABQ3J0W8_9GAMM|nr:LysR family transcriptional regulator [Thalassotalea profundi]GHE97663.1 LysR family transcriptional regulator [Thalassotalea profundi]